MSEKTIKNDSVQDLDAMEAFDMAVGIEPGNDVYVCSVCGWEYNPELGLPEKGIAPGTKFEDLPDDFKCPRCGAPKSAFNMKEEINVEGEESWTNA